MTEITVGMVNHLNSELAFYGVGFKYLYIDNNMMQISVADPKGLWVQSSIVNCTNEFYNWLENWFKTNYNITIDYNNTRSIIWAR